MSFTNDPSTDIGLIRLKITDRDQANAIFQDEELQAFFNSENSSVFRASAAALEAIAIDQVLVLKVIKLLQLSTDGAKMADSLLKLATRYREQADVQDAAGGGNFDWAEFIDDPFAERERIRKEILRGSL